MKAPDIVGLETDSFGEISPFWVDKEHAHIEYIRKDALLEWAEDELRKACKSSLTIGRRNAFIDIVDKINSL